MSANVGYLAGRLLLRVQSYKKAEAGPDRPGYSGPGGSPGCKTGSGPGMPAGMPAGKPAGSGRSDTLRCSRDSLVRCHIHSHMSPMESWSLGPLR